MIDEQKFVAGIESDNADERFGMWRRAGEAPPSVLAELGRLTASSNPGVARAAAEAMTTMVHSVGKDPAAPNRGAVVEGLLGVAGRGALPARVHALRLLSEIAGADAVPRIAAHLKSPELREEAVFALERIPGDAATQAILAAYPTAAVEFQPRLLAALGHRRAVAAAPQVEQAMQSKDKSVALAAALAYGRIGTARAPGSGRGYPTLETYAGIERDELMDSMLRQADAMVKQRNTKDAMAIYRTALASPVEHWQCAGIIGLSKTGVAEAADAILPMMKSDRRTVRITAQQAWRRMAG